MQVSRNKREGRYAGFAYWHVRYGSECATKKAVASYKAWCMLCERGCGEN